LLLLRFFHQMSFSLDVKGITERNI